MLAQFGIEASRAAQYVIAFAIILGLVALFGVVLRKLTGSPQVLALWHVTGEFTFVVHMVARDMEDYDGLVTNLLSDDERIRSFQTLVVMREAKSQKPLPAALK